MHIDFDHEPEHALRDPAQVKILSQLKRRLGRKWRGGFEASRPGWPDGLVARPGGSVDFGRAAPAPAAE